VQEEGSLPAKRSGEGGAKRRSAQAKRGRLGCLFRAPEAEPLSRLGYLASARSAEIAFVVVPASRGGRSGRERAAEILSRLSRLFFSL
jgi:hypothetical protein